MGIKRSGPILATRMGSGGWTAAGVRAYLSLQEDGEAELKALSINIDKNIDSDDS